jgi:hypothetical protein
MSIYWILISAMAIAMVPLLLALALEYIERVERR